MTLPLLNLICTTSNIINAITSLILGLIVLLKNPRSKLHQLWWWMSLAITIWGAGLAFSFSLLNNYPLALFSIRIADTTAIFIPLLFLHFIIVFLQRTDQWRVLKICYALSILLACFGFSSFYIPGVKTKMGIQNFNDAGPLFFLFGALYAWEPLYAMKLMWQARQAASRTRRAHITYVMVAGLVGFLVGAMWFPLCFNIPLLPIGGCFVWLYCLLVAWAVFKYQLFNIRIVIRRSLVYSFLVTLLTVGYFGIIYGLEQLSQSALGYRSFWVSLGAFAMMALLFQPLKIVVQRAMDWALFRAPQEHLAKKIERLEEQTLQAEKFRAVSAMAAGMAHEIKNPLTTLKTYTSFIPEKSSDPEFLSALHQTFTHELERIHSIVKDVLEFAKPKPPQMEPVDPGLLLTSTVDFLSNELIDHRIHWSIDCQHNGTLLRADQDQMRQVFINLIQNAIEAMPAGGQLTLSTQSINSHLEMIISDTGQGIPRVLLPKIFDPFVSTKPTGNGLGLAMVHSIVRAHGGTIQADSQPGRGTTFTVSLPL